MDAQQRVTLRSQIVKAFSLCLAGVLLFLAERAWLGRDTAIQQVPWIVGIATLFFALVLPASAMFLRIMRNGGKRAMGFYILHKGVRLMLAIALLVLYAFASRDNLLVFAINLFALYIVEMVTSVIYATKMERITKSNQ